MLLLVLVALALVASALQLPLDHALGFFDG
jgi:hypothetical protein